MSEENGDGGRYKLLSDHYWTTHLGADQTRVVCRCGFEATLTVDRALRRRRGMRAEFLARAKRANAARAEHMASLPDGGEGWTF